MNDVIKKIDNIVKKILSSFEEMGYYLCIKNDELIIDSSERTLEEMIDYGLAFDNFSQKVSKYINSRKYKIVLYGNMKLLKYYNRIDIYFSSRFEKNKINLIPSKLKSLALGIKVFNAIHDVNYEKMDFLFEEFEEMFIPVRKRMRGGSRGKKELKPHHIDKMVEIKTNNPNLPHPEICQKAAMSLNDPELKTARSYENRMGATALKTEMHRRRKKK